MGKFTGMDGREILKKAAAEITRHGTEMSLTAEWDHLPNEHRARVRAEKTVAVKAARAEARGALYDWAKAERESASKRLNANPIGSAAEESRRLAEEVRIGRMVDTARASGNARSKASDLAEQASRAYAVGNGDEARVLARAAVELGENTYAVEIVKNVDLDRTLADPEKARALRSLNDVDVVLAAFDRDINAATSKAMQDGATLARALGDTFTAQRLMTEASSFGREAKGAAWENAQATGTKYQEPVGVVPGTPTNVQNVPDGAKLPERGSANSGEA